MQPIHPLNNFYHPPTNSSIIWPPPNILNKRTLGCEKREGERFLSHNLQCQGKWLDLHQAEESTTKNGTVTLFEKYLSHGLKVGNRFFDFAQNCLSSFFSRLQFNLPVVKGEEVDCFSQLTVSKQNQDTLHAYLQELREAIEAIQNGDPPPSFSGEMIDDEKKQALDRCFLEDPLAGCKELLAYDSEHSLLSLPFHPSSCSLSLARSKCLEVELRLKLSQALKKLREHDQNEARTTDGVDPLEKDEDLNDFLIYLGLLFALGTVCGTSLVKGWKRISKKERDKKTEEESPSTRPFLACKKISPPILEGCTPNANLNAMRLMPIQSPT